LTKAKITQMLSIMDNLYPDTRCFLDYDEEKPWQLLMATILSAQCTDVRVNIITAQLFLAFPTIEALATADISKIEEIIKTCGLYRAKAGYLKDTATALLSEHSGVIPKNIDALTKMPGVGRKTANVVLAHIYGVPCIAVDTHVARVAFRLGLTKNDSPIKIENDLMKAIPKTHILKFSTQIIAHGRAVCTARSAKCADCTLSILCKHGNTEKKGR